MIIIETKRYSVTVRAFVEKYPLAISMLDNHVMQESPDKWCVNSKLQNAIDFSLTQNEVTLLGFHDGPGNMWATMGTLPFVQSLAERKLLRFYIANTKVADPPLRLLGSASIAIMKRIALLLFRRSVSNRD